MIKRQKDYRHYICIAITIAFLGLGYFYVNSFPRIIESILDFFTSIAYYFCELFMDENPISPTVMQMPQWEILPSVFEPITILPEWNEFQAYWSRYWQVFASKENILAYFSWLGDTLYYLSRYLLIFIPIIVLLILLVNKTLETINHKDNKDSKPLQVYRKFTFKIVYPIRDWTKDFILFLRRTKYLKVWLWLWAIYFNVISIVISFFGFYFYLISSFEFQSIYFQLQKLLYDLTPMLRTIPVFCWVIIGIVILCLISRAIGFVGLYHRERCNRGFINERGVVSIVYGNMGVGKTALITDMALSAEVQLRDMAFEILLESDYKYPTFPWINVRRELKRAIESRTVVDVPSVRQLVSYWKYLYCKNLILRKRCKDKSSQKSLKRHNKKLTGFTNYIFDYDDENYPLVYNDMLKITDIFETIEDYACAYLIYTVQSSLIFSNYSIRTDNIMKDLGNFPLWDTDFFKRDSRLMDSYSRHSHILDFDMLRLGKRMLDDNPNRNAFGFGVYVISEIDKERKNALELQETKSKTNECNQKNDLFNACLKMSRHACVISNRVFLKIFCDLQRPEDWGAGGREVGEVLFIEDKGDMLPTLPFFAPFWLFDLITGAIKKGFDKFYTKFIHNRSDNILLVHLLKNGVTSMDKHCINVNNTFGSQTLAIEVESGRMDREGKKRKYYRMSKKNYSKRYATNCLSAIFQNGEVNTMYVDDFIEYVDIMASQEELAKQNSHFQNDLKKVNS